MTLPAKKRGHLTSQCVQRRMTPPEKSGGDLVIVGASILLESIDWPEQVVGQRVAVDGVLSRQWHASVGTLRTSPWPWNAEVKNHLTGTGMGFGYCLRDCVFEIADKKVPQANERDGHD